MKPDISADVPQMQQTIKSTGDKPIEGDVRLTVSNIMQREGEHLRLHVNGQTYARSLTLLKYRESRTM